MLEEGEERECSYQERSEGWGDLFSEEFLPVNVL